MKHKILLVAALLCMTAQGAWADKWNGSTTSCPAYDPNNKRVVIRSAAELAYIRDHWSDKSDYDELKYTELYFFEGNDNKCFYEWDYILEDDLDMSAANWKPMGSTSYKGTFNGNGHTIRFKIDDSSISSNFQTLFETIEGTVKNLHVGVKIKVGNARNVAGICGENNGTIENCWVSGHIESNHYSAKDAELGGIAGLNNNSGTIKYCCVTADVKNTNGNFGVGGIAGSNEGTIQHVTFYGNVSVDHSQDNKWVGDQDGTLENNYDSFNQSEYDAASGNDMYRRGIKYPYSVSWPKQGAGTESNPYIISNAEEWNKFAYNVFDGNCYRGKFVKLTADISVTAMVGSSEINSFQGTFLGSGKKLTFTRGSVAEPFMEYYCAPFRYVKDATIRGLRVSGDIYMQKMYAGGLVSSCYGTTNITNCHVTTVIHSSTFSDLGVVREGSHGGFVARTAGRLTITDCIYDGKLFTTNHNYYCGGYVGDGNGQTISITNSFYAPDPRITAASDESAIRSEATFVRGGSTTITDCYYTQRMGAAQGTQVYTDTADNEIYKTVKDFEGRKYYMPCTIVGVEKNYNYTGQAISIVPTVTATDGTVLKEGTDYTCTINPATVREKGEYTLTISANGNSHVGMKTYRIIVADGTSVTSETTSLTTGEYVVNNNQNVNERITISGYVVLHLCEGVTYTAKKGIELSEGNSLIIDGFGTLTIDGCDSGKSGIGAANVGTLTINGVTVNVTGGDYAAALGGDKNNAKGGTITINGGMVNAKGGKQAAGIGGGADDQPGHYGVCGDITINGGQVTAQGGYRAEKFWRYGNLAGIGPGAEKPNPEGDYYDSGTLKLGWTNDTDFIDCSGFANPQGSTLTSITFANGKEFLLEGTETVATIENCRGRKIVPPEVPYTISNTAEWNDFANAVAGGNSFKGKLVKLTADISVTQQCGTVEGSVQKNAFSGTFDGGGHTITATITDNSNQGTALFSYINGATIKNLKVAGNINSNQRHAAAIVGFSKGTGNSIVNCAATANVNGNEYIGGILGHAIDSDISISGCTFSGLMTGGSNYTGVFIGWGDSGTRKVTDCLYIMQDGQNTTNLNLVKDSGNLTITNSYKTTTAEHNGTQPQNVRRRSLTPNPSPRGEGSPDGETDDEIDESIYDAIWANEYDTMPEYFGEFLLDYGFLKVYEGGLEYDGKYYVANILLADDADNYALISLANEYIVDVTLTGRTFYKDGTWQTICLPFDVNDFNGTPLEDALVKELDNAGEGCKTGFDVATGTLTLDFVDADRIEAGKPYVVKWESGENIVDPVFRGVTISDEDPIEQRTMSEDERVHFVGIYCPVMLEGGNDANLCLGSDGLLHCPETDDFCLNSFHAGFLVDLDGTSLSSIVINLGEATGIRSIDNGQLIMDNSWYSLGGRKLPGKPTAKGIYVNGQRKVVIK